MTRLRTAFGRSLALTVAVASGGVLAGVGAWAASAPAPVPTVRPVAAPALAQDAPDPDVVRVGSTYYAFTTGTTWGNQIGVATTTAATPATGWRTLGSAFRANGDAAPPASWERNNTATSPGVISIGGRWTLFYDAVDKANGLYCLSVATSASITGPYVDSSRGPFECQTSLGGSIDPQPFVDPRTGRAYLMWKSNDGSSRAASQVWSAPLLSGHTTLAAAPKAVFTIKSATYHWQTTTDDPSMVYAGGHYYLFFSGGNYLSGYYPVGYVLCAGPLGGCDQNEQADPVLSGAGGTGGGTEVTDASGRWWIAYQSWKPSGCTHYGGSCKREMFVAPLSLPH